VSKWSGGELQGPEKREAEASLNISYNAIAVIDTDQVVGLWNIGHSNGVILDSCPRPYNVGDLNFKLFGKEELSENCELII